MSYQGMKNKLEALQASPERNVEAIRKLSLEMEFATVKEANELRLSILQDRRINGKAS